MKKVLIILGSAALAVVVAAGLWFWNGFSKFMAMEVVKVDPQLTYYSGTGNSIVLTSEDGKSALVVDTKMRDAASKLYDAVKAGDVTIVNTHSHADHTAGNDLYPKAKIIAGAYSKEQWEKDSSSSRYPDITLKPGEEKEIKIGNETAVVRNMGRAHTMNDVVVYLKNRKLLVTGDLVFINMHPAVKNDSGASVANWIKALDDLKSRYAIQKLVPGHGPVSDAGALDLQKEYFVSIGEAMGREEKLAELKKKYDGYYALPAMTSFDRTAKFLENEKKEAGK
ncbi:MAG TPA: MBL fold metallo-hydrolase [Spirochaetota bacterium]|nr:MBL fold metallo-hydrolase [Spirochaetota bacterium]HPV41741.1 MBL fold metallo-hydrolase [Spirochaetota bacterium]